MVDEILARSNLQRAFERVRARKRPERESLALPPALDLWTYLELKNREAADGPALYH